MIRSQIARGVAVALAALLCAQATAQDTPRYNVEVIVLAHTNPFAAGERFDLSDNLFGDAASLAGDIDADLNLDEAPEVDPLTRLGTFEPLGAQDFELTETVRRLGNASRFRVLGHFGWQQEAVDTAEALASPVAATDTDGRVNGTILLSRSRFLRLDLDLTFADGSQSVNLRQTRRRVQTGKPHYIDHPYFGVIVQVMRAAQVESRQ